MKKKFIAVALATILFATAGVLWSNWTHGDPQKAIHISGNIELTEINVAFKTAGKLIELNADEGNTVQRGMLLARIDQDQIARQHDKEQAVLAVAQSELMQLNTSIQYTQQTAEGELMLRQAELKQAEAHLKELVAGSRPQEVQQAE